MKKNKAWVAWIIELLIFFICIGLGIYFLRIQQCQWELILVAIWGIILLVLSLCLVWTEWRVYKRSGTEHVADRRG